MAKTFELGCDQCKESVWVGQSFGPKRPFGLYLGEPKIMDLLEAFLLKHRGHPLRFLEAESLPDDWTELTDRGA